MIKAIDFLSLFLDEWDDWRLPRWQLGRDKVGKGVGRHRGDERGMMLVCYLAGSGDRTLKKMYSVPEFYFEVWEMSRIVPEGYILYCKFSPCGDTTLVLEVYKCLHR
ncbi:hypothetical protein Tco_1238823 [Tanacetum coccineum]